MGSYRTPAQQRDSLRQLGWRALAVGGAILAMCAAMWRHEVVKDWIAHISLAGAIVIAISLLCVLVGMFWPRDQPMSNYTCRQIKAQEVATVRRFAENHIGPAMPTDQQLRAMLAVNHDLFYAIESPPQNGNGPPALVGFFSILPLKQGAVLRLERAELIGAELLPDHITRKKGTPRGIYIGSVAGCGFRARAFALDRLITVVNTLCRKHNISKVFARPVTGDGLRLLRKFGFKAVMGDGSPVLNLVCYRLWAPPR
jgi:hypothetical protein